MHSIGRNPSINTSQQGLSLQKDRHGWNCAVIEGHWCSLRRHIQIFKIFWVKPLSQSVFFRLPEFATSWKSITRVL